MPDMKYTKIIALITTLLCFLQGQGLALAQDNPNQYNYLYLTIRNGLCDNSIRTIHKDHNSFMWFGTSNGRTLGECQPGIGDWWLACRAEALAAEGRFRLERDPDRFYNSHVTRYQD